MGVTRYLLDNGDHYVPAEIEGDPVTVRDIKIDAAEILNTFYPDIDVCRRYRSEPLRDTEDVTQRTEFEMHAQCHQLRAARLFKERDAEFWESTLRFYFIMCEKKSFATVRRALRCMSVVEQTACLQSFSRANERTLVTRLLHIEPKLVVTEHSLANQRSGTLTSFMWAALYGYHGLARDLLSARAKVNTTRGRMTTALMLASLNAQESMVRFLLHHGAEVNARDGLGQTSLHFAARGCHFHVAQTLLEAKAEVDAVCEPCTFRRLTGTMDMGPGQCLVGFYFSMHHPSHRQPDKPYRIFNSICLTEDPRHCDPTSILTYTMPRQTPLFAALETKWPLVAELLLKHRANVHQCNEKGESCLKFAAGEGLALIVGMLLDHGARTSLLERSDDVGGLAAGIRRRRRPRGVLRNAREQEMCFRAAMENGHLHVADMIWHAMHREVEEEEEKKEQVRRRQEKAVENCNRLAMLAKMARNPRDFGFEPLSRGITPRGGRGGGGGEETAAGTGGVSNKSRQHAGSTTRSRSWGTPMIRQGGPFFLTPRNNGEGTSEGAAGAQGGTAGGAGLVLPIAPSYAFL